MRTYCCAKQSRLDVVVARAESDLAGIARKLARRPESTHLRTMLEAAKADRTAARQTLAEHSC